MHQMIEVAQFQLDLARDHLREILTGKTQHTYAEWEIDEAKREVRRWAAFLALAERTARGG